MKITKSKLEQVIKEEIINMLQEAPIDRLKGGAGDPRSTRVGLGDKPAAQARKEMAPFTGMPTEPEPEKWRTGRDLDQRARRVLSLLDEFKRLEDELRTALSTGHPVDEDRKAKIFDLKAAMKRKAHQIKTYWPEWEMPEWIDDPTWEGFRAIEKIPGMLTQMPSEEDLRSIKREVAQMSPDELMDTIAEGVGQGKAVAGTWTAADEAETEGPAEVWERYPMNDPEINKAYKKAAQKELDARWAAGEIGPGDVPD